MYGNDDDDDDVDVASGMDKRMIDSVLFMSLIWWIEWWWLFGVESDDKNDVV